MLGKDPEAIVVSFASGDPELAARMFAEVQQLVPERRHFLVKPAELAGLSTLQSYRELRKRFGAYRIGLAPVLFDREGRYRALRRAAFLLAPTKILAYNERLERHHLRLRTAIASILFLRGVPLDRIFLRPMVAGALEAGPFDLSFRECWKLKAGRCRRGEDAWQW